MFRAQQNAFDDVVGKSSCPRRPGLTSFQLQSSIAAYRIAINFDLIAKATDENLTSENWEYIMDVCDKVTTEDSGAKDAVASMIKRLAHRNANVQLYTLEVKLPLHR